MNWVEVRSESDLNNIIENSFQQSLGVAIFKHSTRCSISSVAKMRLSSAWDSSIDLPVYYVDVLDSRTISDQIEDKFKVIHESPQLLLIKDSKCIYHASHLAISFGSLSKALKIKI